MPKIAKKLSHLEVTRINTPGHHAVGGVSGLLLQVTKSGAKSWILRTVVGKVRRDIGLGSFTSISLADAREAALKKKAEIAEGKDPVLENKRNKAQAGKAQDEFITFKEAARQWHALKSKDYKNAKHADQVINTLTEYAFPIIGDMHAADIETPHVLQVLTHNSLWERKTETATRVRQRIEAVLGWCTVKGYRKGDNPARWQTHLSEVLTKPSTTKQEDGKGGHQPALPVEQVNEFIREIRNHQSVTAKALEFIILTAARAGMVIKTANSPGMTWDEVDLKNKVWTIPAWRMKGVKENAKESIHDHPIPLSDEALELLESLPRFENNPYVFTLNNKLRSAITDTTLRVMIRSINDARKQRGLNEFVDPKQDNKIITIHGFRSVFRDWCSESTDYDHDVIEMAMAHQINNKVVAAYLRSKNPEKRRPLMQDWSDYIYGKPTSGNVININAKRGAK